MKSRYIIIFCVIILMGIGYFFLEVPKVNKEIIYTNSSPDLISIDTPLPGSITEKEFNVTGNARGVWYFEASFPIEVLDKDGNLLATGIAQANGDWMTTEFVPFQSKIKIPNSYTGKATLILKKDNPSDMRDKDASVSFLIIIK